MDDKTKQDIVKFERLFFSIIDIFELDVDIPCVNPFARMINESFVYIGVDHFQLKPEFDSDDEIFPVKRMFFFFLESHDLDEIVFYQDGEMEENNPT